MATKREQDIWDFLGSEVSEMDLLALGVERVSAWATRHGASYAP